MSRRYFDVCVVIPLEEELIAFRDAFDCNENLSTPTRFRFRFNTGAKGIEGLVIQQEEMGRKFASRAVAEVKNEFEVGLFICLGIAGSLSADANIGDVCYSTRVLDVYDNAKIEEHTPGDMDHQFSPSWYRAHSESVAAINFSRTFPDLGPRYQNWQRKRLAEGKKLIAGKYRGRSGEEELLEPKAIPGILACASVSKSPKYNKEILKIERKILAIETESGGVFEAADKIPAISIRGISDFADPGKSELEETTKGRARKIAAQNACEFLKFQLSNPYFTAALSSLRTGNELAGPWSDAKNGTQNVSLAGLYKQAAKKIDSSLRELSPEYRLQKHGYVLPIPRLVKLESNDGAGQGSDRFVHFKDAVVSERVVFIKIEKNYPDKGLPWIFAREMLEQDIEGKIALPVVIEGRDIKPPESTAFRLISKEHDGFERLCTSVAPIVILTSIHSPNTGPNEFILKRRSEFLLEQLKSDPNLRFVIIAQDPKDKILADSWASEFNTTPYELCEISFFEIAKFLEKNFEMPASEAEVVANQLRSLFRQFDLTAHPTYFAGIPHELLSSLLHANRRAELISLAVAGFLSFVVAGDTSTVALSRTTREIFLRKLVFEMKVELKSFDRPSLVQFTKDIAEAHDYDIEPISFVNDFIEKGILHFHEERVEFSLPFIQSFLLAKELSLRAVAAKKYFSQGAGLFDTDTFSLYAEIGPDKTVVDDVIEQLKLNLAMMQKLNPDREIFFGAQVNPNFLVNSDMLERLEKRLKGMAEKIDSNSNERQEKQKILDLSERVGEKAREKRAAAAREFEQDIDDEGSDLNKAFNSFVVAATLLGSGSERLEAKTKQEIISKVVELCSDIMCFMMKLGVSADFEGLKSELVERAELEEAFGKVKTDGQRDRQRKIVEELVAIIEFNFLSMPFRGLLGLLTENARSTVLYASIQKVALEEKLPSLILDLWAGEIDSEKHKSKLVNQVKKLPKATFLRTVLFYHLLNRVYWHQWKKENRRALLEVAEAAIKSMSLTLKTEEIEKSLDELNQQAY